MCGWPFILSLLVSSAVGATDDAALLAEGLGSVIERPARATASQINVDLLPTVVMVLPHER